MYLHNEEWSNFYVELTRVAAAHGAGLSGVEPLLQQIAELHHRADKLLQTVHRSLLTGDLTKAVTERRRLFRGFYGTVKIARLLPGAEEQTAARRLFIIASNHRASALSGSLAEESGAVTQLLENLDRKISADDIALLGVGKWVEGLRETEQRYRALSAAREQEYIRKPQEQLREIRRRTDVLYRSVIHTLEAALIAEQTGSGETPGSETPASDASRFADAWNLTVKKYHQIITARITHHAKDSGLPPDEASFLS
jgi:hypothetical protein